MAAALVSLRTEAGTDSSEPYDIVAALPPGTDPLPYAAAGATWWAVEFPPEALTVDLVRAVIRDGLHAGLNETKGENRARAFVSTVGGGSTPLRLREHHL